MKQEVNIKDTLTKYDWEKWKNNTIIFSLPAVLAFLQALQSGDLSFAMGASYSVLLASTIDLLIKYKSGIEAPKQGEQIVVINKKEEEVVPLENPPSEPAMGSK